MADKNKRSGEKIENLHILVLLQNQFLQYMIIEKIVMFMGLKLRMMHLILLEEPVYVVNKVLEMKIMVLFKILWRIKLYMI